MRRKEMENKKESQETAVGVKNGFLSHCLLY